MIHLSTLLRYYKREDIQKAIAQHGRDKEVAVRYNDRFGRRPDMMRYPADVLASAQKGASSFHASEELWTNPMQLSPTLKREELDELRKGWDLLLDIDCAVFEYSKIAAILIIDALKAHGISSLSVKFSGNKGFHIGIPYEAFPEQMAGKDMALLFPEAPRKIAHYLKELIKEPLGRKIMEFENADFSAILEKTAMKESDIIQQQGNSRILNAEPFLVIDTVLISSRHLYRMPYSLHEKSGLVSVPLAIEQLPSFERDDAQPEKITAELPFLDREKARKNDALSLFVEAFDFSTRRPVPEKEEVREYEIPEEAIPEQFFPDCIKKIFAGLEDGKKRALFILVNFLSSVGWDYEAIDKRVREWNDKNKEPLREVYIVSQLRYAKQQGRKMMPPSCSNDAYYRDLGVKCDESVCSRCKNPVICAKKRAQYASDGKEGKKSAQEKQPANTVEKQSSSTTAK